MSWMLRILPRLLWVSSYRWLLLWAGCKLRLRPASFCVSMGLPSRQLPKVLTKVASTCSSLTGSTLVRLPPEGIYKGDASIKNALLQAAADPLQAAVAYGRQTGSCSCCGRELTDPVSIFGGIGPICLAKLAGNDARADLEADYREYQAAALIDVVLAI